MKRWLCVLILSLVTSQIWAQGCSLCSLSAEGLGNKAGTGLNHGIMYLGFVPLIAVFVIGGIWYRRNKAAAREEDAL